MSQYYVCHTNGKVIGDKLDKIEAETLACNYAKDEGIVTVVRQHVEKKVVVRSITAHTNHAQMMVVARKRKSDGKQKILRVGTLDEVRDYCVTFVKNNGYCPAIRRAVSGAVAGAYI